MVLNFMDCLSKTINLYNGLIKAFILEMVPPATIV